MGLKKYKNDILLVIIVESIISILWLILIPSDPKNAFFLGFSQIRLAQVIFIILGTFFLLFSINNRNFSSYFRKIITKFFSENFLEMVSFVSFLFLLIVLLTPSYQLKPYSAEYERFQPIIFWGSSIVANFYFYKKVIKREFKLDLLKNTLENKKLIFLFLVLILIFSGLWIFLNINSDNPQINNLVFSPPAPLTSLQIFILFFISLIFLQKLNFPIDKFFNSVWFPLLIFIFSFLIWYLLPLPCTNDLIGPYPPNYICYPSSSDAIYSIASHYGRLGNGIYNQWFTDKPVYIFFLMILQWISSPKITDYITLQIMVFALIPTISFLFVKKFFNWQSGLFFASLIIFHEINQISGYQFFGGVNSKIEGTEIFTALLLLVFGIVAFVWFLKPSNKLLAITSGGLLGISSLARLNPLFILPFVIILIFGVHRGINKKSIVMSLFFVIGFFVAFSPWYLFSSDSDGQNYLLKKIEDVLSTRYRPIPEVEIPPSSFFENNESMVKTKLLINRKSNIEADNAITKIIYHFINNYYQIYFTLPSKITFDSLSHHSSNPIWKDHMGFPIWHYSLSIQNAILLITNFALIIWGIIQSFYKHKFSGLVPLIIQFGYIFGTSLALTSGNRYLVPIIWVTFFYFTIGIISVIRWILNIFSRPMKESKPQAIIISTDNTKDTAHQKNLTYFVLFIFFILSFGLTKLNIIPDRIPTSSKMDRTELQEILINFLSKEDLNKVMNENEIVVYQGISYHPKYYRNYFYAEAPENFELLTLTNEEVLVSYIRNFPDNYFSDESKTTIIGCPIKKENRWGADFIIVDALIIIQNDAEKSVFVSPKLELGCENLSKNK